MAFNPQDVRAFGKVSGGADNVQLRVAATGEVYITVDTVATPRGLPVDIQAANAGAGDSILVYGSDDAGATVRVLKTDASGRPIITTEAGQELKVNLTHYGGTATTLGQKLKAASIPVVLPSDQVVQVQASEPGVVDVRVAGEQTAIAAAATSEILNNVPANGKTLAIEYVNIQGSGSFKWQVIYSADGVADTEVLARGYTSPSSPKSQIPLGRRYKLLGDGTKKIKVKATNIDLTLQADASAELVGSTD